MNRKQFLKRLGIGAVAVVVTPKILAKKDNLTGHFDAERVVSVNDECGKTNISIDYPDWIIPSKDPIEAVISEIHNEMWLKYSNTLYKGHQHESFVEFCINAPK
jgi:hypothetical protein